MQRLQAREGTPTTGSRTVSQEVTPAPEEREGTPLVLHLRSTPNPDERRVTWDEEVIDNENMGKKSSKGTKPPSSCLP
jgi:Protein phosphatase inhibitor